MLQQIKRTTNTLVLIFEYCTAQGAVRSHTYVGSHAFLCRASCKYSNETNYSSKWVLARTYLIQLFYDKFFLSNKYNIKLHVFLISVRNQTKCVKYTIDQRFKFNQEFNWFRSRTYS